MGKHAIYAVCEHHAAVERIGPVDAAHVVYAQEAFFVDMGHDKADVIHVRGHHDLFAPALAGGDEVAQRVGRNFIHIRLDHAADGAGDVAFAPGRAVSAGEGQQGIFDGLHFGYPSWKSAFEAKKAFTRR